MGLDGVELVMGQLGLSESDYHEDAHFLDDLGLS